MVPVSSSRVGQIDDGSFVEPADRRVKRALVAVGGLTLPSAPIRLSIRQYFSL